MVVGAVVAAGVFCAGAADGEGAGLSSRVGAQGTDVAVVLVGVVVAVVVVVVDVAGSHGSACAGARFAGDSAGWAMLTATGVVTRNNAAVEITRARVSICLRRVKCGADFKAIRYPSSSTWQSGAALIAPLWTCWIESPPTQRIWIYLVVSLRVAIAVHGKELLISFTGIAHIGLVTDQSDWFKVQVGGFPSGKVSTFGGPQALWGIWSRMRHMYEMAPLQRFCLFDAEGCIRGPSWCK